MLNRRGMVLIAAALCVLVLAGAAFSKGSLKKAAKLMDRLWDLPEDAEFDPVEHGLNPKKIRGGWPTPRSFAADLDTIKKDLDVLKDAPDMSDVVAALQDLGEKLDGLRGDVQSVETAVAGVEARVEQLETGVATIRGIRKTEGEVVTPTKGNVDTLVSVNGPGTFISARVRSKNVVTHLVEVEIDGIVLFKDTFANLFAYGETTRSMFGINMFDRTAGSGEFVIVVGFPQPVTFKNKIELRLTSAGGSGTIDGVVIHAD